MTTLKQYREKLLGQTITDVHHLTIEDAQRLGLDRASLVMVLENGVMVLIKTLEDLEP